MKKAVDKRDKKLAAYKKGSLEYQQVLYAFIMILFLANVRYFHKERYGGSADDDKEDIKLDLRHKIALLERKEDDITDYKRIVSTLETQNRKSLGTIESQKKLYKKIED